VVARDVFTELLINRSILHLGSVVLRRSGCFAVDGTAKWLGGGRKPDIPKTFRNASMQRTVKTYLLS
jgi:predicted pyridoxine 5'-phosphate oxidase superfamily flavin-nucleotide-binding protein